MLMCEPCRRQSDAWLVAKVPTGLSFTFGSGAAYDATPRGVEERRQARARAWYAIVREHVEGIRLNCAAGFHAQDVTSNT